MDAAVRVPKPIAFPALLDATEAQSASSQTTFLAARGIELIALSTAALFGAIPRDDLLGAGPTIALCLFVVALVVRASGVGDRAEKRWYDARAASESIKSASWQFAVCGEAFRLGDEKAEARFLSAQQQVLGALPHLSVPTDPSRKAITDDMRRLRESDPAVRRETYVRDRVGDQERWYSSKANLNRRRTRHWTILLVTLEAVACLLGLLRVLGWFDVDWLGLLAVVSASVAAWKQTKNYSGLSESYSVTSHEVGILASAIVKHVDEQAWSQAVHDAEAAFSREHTLWLARRQGPRE